MASPANTSEASSLGKRVVISEKSRDANMLSKFQKLVINISKFGAYDILDYFERFSRFHSVV